jgi:hypothetical protein
LNALNLNVLNREAESALSETAGNGKNPVNVYAGNNNSGSGILGGVKTADSGISAGSFQGAGQGIDNPASGGNSGGSSLTGGNIDGLDDPAGETNAFKTVNSVIFMLKKNLQSATITLSPASLGTVKINIALSSPNSVLNLFNQSGASGGAITVNMLAQNEAAKNMLQSSSDSLQNALKNQGFSSINLNISTGSGYNNGAGNNGSETFKNPFADAGYNGRFSNTAPESGSIAAGTNNYFGSRNPNALVDYFV